jgi:hypothetical protein
LNIHRFNKIFSEKCLVSALYGMVVKQFENGFLSRSQIKHLVISKNENKK